MTMILLNRDAMPSASTPRRRRWLQFSLRSLLILTAVVAVVLAWGNRLVLRYDARQRIAELPVQIELQTGPAWIGRWFGAGAGKYFDQVAALDFSGCQDLSLSDVNRRLLPDVGRQSGLRRLNLAGHFEVDDCGVEAIAGLSNLEELVLDETGGTDDGLRHLAGMSRLKKLSLYAAHGITGRGLEHLAGLERLEVLDLSATDLGDEAAEVLARLPRLRWLNLADTLVGDAALEHIGGLSQLEYLNLSGTKVTSAGMAHLAGLTHLTDLYVAHTQVDDSGLDRLAGLRLRLLSVAQTAVSQRRQTELARLNPDLFLGDLPTSP